MGTSIAVLFKSVISTIRTGNLFMICLTMYLVRYTIVNPILGWNNFSSSLSDKIFFLLVLAVVCIAAAGYIINDIFDTGIDAINKPGKNKIGNTIKRNHGMILYFTLTGAGLLFSFVAGIKSNMNHILLVNLICAGLLYFYSSSYKKMLLVGNIIISLLTAFAVYSVIIYDKHAFLSEPVMSITGAYAIFAFMMTLIRELIKDCEDTNGDRAFGSSTLAVVAGVKTTRIIAAVLLAGVTGSLIYILIKQQWWTNKIAFTYLVLAVVIPCIYLIIRILISKSQNDDSFAGRFAKLIMLTGILSMPVIYLTSL